MDERRTRPPQLSVPELLEENSNLKKEIEELKQEIGIKTKKEFVNKNKKQKDEITTSQLLSLLEQVNKKFQEENDKLKQEIHDKLKKTNIESLNQQSTKFNDLLKQYNELTKTKTTLEKQSEELKQRILFLQKTNPQFFCLFQDILEGFYKIGICSQELKKANILKDIEISILKQKISQQESQIQTLQNTIINYLLNIAKYESIIQSNFD